MYVLGICELKVGLSHLLQRNSEIDAYTGDGVKMPSQALFTSQRTTSKKALRVICLAQNHIPVSWENNILVAFGKGDHLRFCIFSGSRAPHCSKTEAPVKVGKGGQGRWVTGCGRLRKGTMVPFWQTVIRGNFWNLFPLNSPFLILSVSISESVSFGSFWNIWQFLWTGTSLSVTLQMLAKQLLCIVCL